MRIKEVLTLIGPRQIPLIRQDQPIKEVVRKFVHFPHSRLVYVVDHHGRLVGTITVGSLLRHVFPHAYEPRIHGHGMLGRITSEKAEDIMEHKTVYARPWESVEEVLERMAQARVKEMAVLDEKGRVVADLTAVDLLRHYHLEE